MAYSLQNKIWIFPKLSKILPKFIYDKERKLAGLTQILPVRVRGSTLILKTGFAQDCSMSIVNSLRPSDAYMRQ